MVFLTNAQLQSIKNVFYNTFFLYLHDVIRDGKTVLYHFSVHSFQDLRATPLPSNSCHDNTGHASGNHGHEVSRWNEAAIVDGPGTSGDVAKEFDAAVQTIQGELK